MEGELRIEEPAFHESPDSTVSLFYGTLGEQSLSVVVRKHRFKRSKEHQKDIATHFSAVARDRSLDKCALLQVHFRASSTEFELTYVLEAPHVERRRYVEPKMLHSLLPLNSEVPWIEDIEAEYQLPANPHAKNAGARFYEGVYEGARSIGVVVKKYKFEELDDPDTQKRISICLTVAIAQKQHPHCCELLDVLVRMKKDKCTIYHVLERLSNRLSDDIAGREEQQPYTELELKNFLQQASTTLASIHSRNITHQSLDPGVIFRSGEIYKILDLGCYLSRKKFTKFGLAYRSPQLTRFIEKQAATYDKKKADVFSLGMIVLTMASLKPQTVNGENIDGHVAETLAPLSYSEQLKALLRDMLAEDEDSRLTMQEVHDRAFSMQVSLHSVQAQGETSSEALDQKPVVKASFLRPLSGPEASQPNEQETIKSKPLVLIDKASFSTQLVNTEVFKFSINQPCLPIFVTGSMGKQSLLRDLACPQASFECDKDDPDGVYLWPHPVELGETSVLFFKLRYSNNDNPAYLELRRRVKAAFMALSSVWIICESDLTETQDALKSVIDDYKKMRKNSSVEMSKVYVCAYEDWFEDEDEAEYRNQVTEEYGDFVEIIKRGGEDSPEDAEVLADLRVQLGRKGLHEPYLRSHSTFIENDFSTRFAVFLEALQKLANLDVHFSSFLSKIPNFDTPSQAIQELLQTYKKKADYNNHIKSSGEALNFIVEKPVGSRLVSQFDDTILENLQKHYNLKEKTIVLATLGSPGLGKSTLLNHIIQFCTEAPTLPSIFKYGSSCGHTTRGSQVLSHPLYLKDKQLMLIDLEGLGGTETRDVGAFRRQENLIKAIKTISSVLAILVSNDYQQLESASSHIASLASLHRDFGFKTKRVILLFHDKEQDAPINPHFKKEVEKLNDDVFEGRNVVVILNKPNFVASEERVRTTFLQTFLDKCNFVKKYAKGGKSLNIQSLLTELSVIATHESESLREIQLDPKESAAYNKTLSTKCKELKAYASSIISVDGKHLVQLFDDSYCGEFRLALKREVEGIGEGVRMRLMTRMDLEAKKIKTKLVGLESCNAFIMLSQKQVFQMIDEYVSYRYRSSWTLVDFLYSVNKLKKLLKKVKHHFPQQSAQLDAAISRFNVKRGWKIGFSAVGYAAQVGLTLATAGVAAYLTVGVQATAMVASRATISAGSAAITAIGTRTGGVCFTTLMISKAEELLYVNSTWRNGKLNKRLLKRIQKTPDHPCPVLLCIGSKSTSLAPFVNNFLRHIAPFTPANCNAFNPNLYTQILSFTYLNPLDNSTTSAFLICLRMKKKTSSKYAEVMLRIARTLLPAASLTCILSDRPNTYVENLLEGLTIPQTRDLLPERKVIVWHSHLESKDQIAALTWKAAAELMDYDLEAVAVCTEKVKTELDTVKVRSSRVLREHILALQPRS